ncbi:MAG TPA: hypothetical protein PK201_10245 [Accumulibacter sp.]|nr:hypothetical protein [Accumulibacter sp.]
MRLSKHGLFKMDDDWLKKLPAGLLLEVSKRLLHDVKELQDQVNQNPGNSSPQPWKKARQPRLALPTAPPCALPSRPARPIS